MTETMRANGEFERKPNREIEKKYLPIFPDMLERLRSEATPIEQMYLSHPQEPFSLRLREILKNGELVYSATLKDRGELGDDGLNRLEVETEINAEVYAYYKTREHVLLRKLRAEPVKNVIIDWFEDGHVQLESENPISWSAFLEQFGSTFGFIDLTGEVIMNNEWRAHLEHRRSHNGAEALTPADELNSETISREIWEHQLHNQSTVVTVAGRSGSGKSTVIRTIQNELQANGVASTVISTDDYHRGKLWLEQYKGDIWTEWDAPIVYDVDTLQADIQRLQNGESIVRQRFDFITEEPIYDGVVEPTPVILIEGIYARDQSFDDIASHRYELQTPLATCIGRRLLRDLHERPQFADSAKSLRYMLEQAEPAYTLNDQE